MSPFRYRTLVEWSEEDALYVARVPALAGCMAHAKTPEGALKEARVAAALMLETMREHGDPMPAEDAGAQYSGQVRLRMPKSLHREMDLLAAEEGVSMNHAMIMLLAKGVAARTREEAPRGQRRKEGRSSAPRRPPARARKRIAS